jgi:hypothetical protein
VTNGGKRQVMAHDPLLTTLLDLDVALASRELIIGGGYGLYLKVR